MADNYRTREDDPWIGSPFQWILSQPSRTKGAIGEALVAGWCDTKGYTVVRSPDSEADLIIKGHRIEVKFSTLWKTGIYKFQQIRNQNYEFCLCLGVSPVGAHAWFIPKSTLMEFVIGHMGQHTGKTGADTAWLSVSPSGESHEWLKSCGGTLGKVNDLIGSLGQVSN